MGFLEEVPTLPGWWGWGERFQAGAQSTKWVARAQARWEGTECPAELGKAH